MKIHGSHFSFENLNFIALISCEGCKGFFRRTIINGIEYLCKSGNNDCNLFLAGARQRCQKCRILKCLKVNFFLIFFILNLIFQTGMNPNFVRKRKDDTIRGPYEPSAPKIYRPSGTNQISFGRK